MEENKSDLHVLKVGQELLEALPIQKQHKIVAVVARIIEEQECEHLLVLPDGCSVYSDSDMEHFMMYEGFDYPDAYRIRAYVKLILEQSIA